LTTEKCRLLIVDDEPALRRALHTSLAESDFEISEARNGEEALTAVHSLRPNIVLLDINMPGMTGFDVCRRLRKSAPQVGIVMVTVRDSEEDKVHALEAGADDFVTKPYRLLELTARLHAVLRRLDAPGHAADSVVRAGSLRIDLESRVVEKNGVEIHLSPKEFDLLAYLARHRGGPVLHTRLLQALWGPEYGGELEYLRSYVKMLRKKIEDDPSRPQYIVTEPWVGYRFHDPSDPHSPSPDEE
jgi:two-component system KDP operon response regulator KdpE